MSRAFVSLATIVGAALAAVAAGGATGTGAASCTDRGWPDAVQGAPVRRTAAAVLVWHDSGGWHLRGRGLRGTVAAGAAIRVFRSAGGHVDLRGRKLSFAFATALPGALDFTASCAHLVRFDLAGSPQILVGRRREPTEPSFTITRPGTTGVDGQVSVGPLCPVEPCDRPPVHPRVTIRIESAGSQPGTLAARVRTDADGRFSAPLAPGRYSAIVERETSGFPLAKPTIFVVATGVVSRIEVTLDTGIR
jgi:hypothetical protein